MFDGLDTKVLDFVTDAACVAIDWLGEKIYWSVYKNGVVSIFLNILLLFSVHLRKIDHLT